MQTKSTTVSEADVRAGFRVALELFAQPALANARDFRRFVPGGKALLNNDDDLNALAIHMASSAAEIHSKIPAGYTYLAQFITHDITLDSTNTVYPFAKIDPTAVKNIRSPQFDLETIYGRETPSIPGEPPRSALLDGDGPKLKLGMTRGGFAGGIKNDYPNDLQRVDNSAVPIIVDTRNDENLAIAQTQVLFIKFHNAICDMLGAGDPAAIFEEARKLTIQHYQWVVLNDFLPKFVDQSVLDDVLKYRSKFYSPNADDLYLPLEFSFGAFRFGHSTVKGAYNWNHLFPGALLADLFDFSYRGDRLEELQRLPSIWIPNWYLLYDIDGSAGKHQGEFNFMSGIDTRITSNLGRLNPNIVGYDPRYSLPALDLFRNRALGFPSGQDVVLEMNKSVGDIQPVLPAEMSELLPDSLKEVFSEETPLWFYFLAESEVEQKKNGGHAGTLGKAGSRIVAETVIGLLKVSPFSILDSGFAPDTRISPNGEPFGMTEMLKFIWAGNKVYDELNPIA